MTVGYDGTRYSGWQVQPNGVTVQAKLEQGLVELTRETVRVTGSGRTDAGVHAIGQVASFSLANWRATDDDLRRALNSKLPPDIAVSRIEDAAEDFHAIRDAVGKRYRYQLQIGGVRDPFEHAFRWHVHAPVDVDAMRAASAHLVGRHDFASFQAAGADRKTTVRHVRAIDITETPTASGGTRSDAADVTSCCQYLTIEIEADGFLYNMVRNIAGTLLEVGRGKRTHEWVADVLAAKDRTVAGPTAPPHGLFLLWVQYPSTSVGVDHSSENRSSNR